MKLKLGVIDVPYSQSPTEYNELKDGAIKKRKLKARKSTKRTVQKRIKPTARKTKAARLETTGDVAERLEDRYGLMQTFVYLNIDEITGYVARSLNAQMEAALLGAPTDVNLLGDAEGELKKRFDDYITNEEEAGYIKGAPTQAALDGINHRFKNPHTGIRRPSFVDTGLYLQSFIAQFEL